MTEIERRKLLLGGLSASALQTGRDAAPISATRARHRLQ